MHCRQMWLLRRLKSQLTQWTRACERVDIVCASGSVLARVGATLVQIMRTVLAAESGHTEAAIVARLVQAGPAVQTWE